MNKTKRRSQRQKRNRNRKSNTKRRMQRAGGIGFSSPKPPAQKFVSRNPYIRENPDVPFDRPIDNNAMFYYDPEVEDFDERRAPIISAWRFMDENNFLNDRNSDKWKERKRFYFYLNNSGEWVTLGTYNQHDEMWIYFLDQRKNRFEKIAEDWHRPSSLINVYYVDDVSQVGDQNSPLKQLLAIKKN